MKEVTAFVCDFCPRKKRFAKRGTALRHELRCFHNPTQRACVTCKHFEMVKPYYEFETGYGEDGGPLCELGILPIDMGPEQPPQIMTSECEKWEEKQEG